MKKLLIYFFMLSTGSVFAQDEQIIKSDFQTIIEYTRKKDIDKVIVMTYPQLFKVMPEAQMKAMANGMLAGMGVTTIFEENPLVLKLSTVKKLTASTICLGRYNQSSILEFKNPALIDMMTKTKMNDIKIEKLSNDKIRMSGVQYLLAIKDAYTNNTWKYLRFDDENLEINAKVLSKEILTAATQLKTTLVTAK